MKAYLKRNKPLLFLPLVLIPFIVLIFYVLGGGEKQEKEEQKQKEKQTAKGANYTLPDADKSVAIYDKMDNYSSKKEVTTSHDYNIAGETDSTNEENPHRRIPVGREVAFWKKESVQDRPCS